MRTDDHSFAYLRALRAVPALAALVFALAMAPRAAGQASPGIAVAVQISTFAIDSGGPFKAGDRLHATLTGSTGGKASFTVLNVSGEVPMAETGAGIYSGTLMIPKNVTVAGAAVVGRLIGADGTPAPLLAAQKLVTIDDLPPAVFAQIPAPGSTVATTQPLIYASLTDGAGTGVNRRSILLLLDGRDITASAQIGTQFTSYTPAAPLAPGEHDVILSAQDNLGNQVRCSWSFRIANNSVQPLVLSADTAGSTPIASADHPLLVTLHGPPGRRAECELPAISHRFPLREISPGTYEGTYSPDSGAGCAQTPVVATLKGVDYTAILDHAAAIESNPPPTPAIEEPGSEIEIGNTLDIAGRASPGALVLADLAYKSRSDTSLFEIDGNAISAWARADEKGNWKITGLPLEVPWLLTPDRITRFTVRATAVDALGRKSETAVTEVMHS